mgnify:CR=1 FL=1
MLLLLLLLYVSLLLLLQAGSPLSQRNRRIARDEVLDMLHHALDSYMKHAYPWDELKPLSCEGRRWDQRERGTLDDSLGGYGLTLVDSMSTLAIVQDGPRLADAVRRVVDDVSFDRDVDISVFEATIRVLGGLLSTHELRNGVFSSMRRPPASTSELVAFMTSARAIASPPPQHASSS